AVPRAVAPRARAVRGVGRTERGRARGDPRRRRPPHGLTPPAPPGRPTTAPSRARARHHPQTRTAPVRRRTGGTCRTTPWRRWGDRPRNAAGPATGRSRALLLHGSASADHHGEDVARGQDEVVLAAVLDLGAAVLAVDDLVADRHVERDAVAVVVDTARTDGQDLALLGLLLGGVRDDQAGCGRGLGLEGLHDDPVLERLDGDRHVGPPLSR